MNIEDLDQLQIVSLLGEIYNWVDENLPEGLAKKEIMRGVGDSQDWLEKEYWKR